MYGLQSASLVPGHPDFLDLPWAWPLDQWRGRCARWEELPRGESRHPVVFVSYPQGIYALKALPPDRAEAEYGLLREMQERRLPVVSPVGHVRVETAEGEAGVLVTRYLERSLPYQALFEAQGLAQHRPHLIDALAGLLVQLHLAGVYWGDCSLANTLFLRDAGALQAYLVDAETSEIHESLGDARREHDLEVMVENVGGGLLDLIALGALPPAFPVQEISGEVHRRYQDLWREIQHEVLLTPQDSFQIEERVRRLNALGFTVGELELAGSGDRLKLRVMVTDRQFHADLLHSLTGLTAQEGQARLLMNELQQVRMQLREREQRSLALSAAAFHWLLQVYRPTTQRMRAVIGAEGFDAVERYCELLEHKWYLSERARRDVGLEAALEDYLSRFATAGARR